MGNVFGTVTAREFYEEDYLNAWITQALTFTDFPYALDQGFTPTSATMPPSGNWGGKYRCIFCRSKGYFVKNPDQYWWGNKHGNNCRKAK